MIISVARMRKGDASRLEARRLSFQLIFADRICLGKVSLKRLLSSGIQRRLLWPLCPRAPLLLCSSTPPHPTPIPPLVPLAVPGTRTSQSARSKNLMCLLERECIGPIGQMAFQRRSSRDLPLLSFFFLPLFPPSPLFFFLPSTRSPSAIVLFCPLLHDRGAKTFTTSPLLRPLHFISY
jgi:hypothetical protein